MLTVSATYRIDQQRPIGCATRIFLALFAVVFVWAGSQFGLAAMRSAEKDRQIARWPAAPCTITRSRVIDHRQGGNNYEWDVAYTYVYGGQEYTSTAGASQPSGSNDYSTLERLQLRYPAGSHATCYVDPSDPRHAVLMRRGLAPLDFAQALFGLVFVAVGCLPLWGAVRGFSQPRQTIPVSQSGARGGCVAALICLVFVSIASMVMWLGFLRPMQRSHEALATWRALPCTIVSSRVVPHRGKRTTYSVDVLYRYQVDGRDYKSNRFDFLGGTSSGYQGKAEIVRRLPPGFSATCWVNPADPLDAVLEPHLGWQVWLIVIPALFFLIGATGLISLTRRASRWLAFGR